MVSPGAVMPPTLLLVLAGLAFCLSLGAGFVFDDFAIFEAPAFTRPLTWLTFRLNQAAGGENPFGFHLVNLALHLVAVWLCRDALGRVIPARAANVAAILFALHPLQSEAVDYVWARSTLLMTVFCLAALRDWLRGRRWMAVAWFVLALLSKEECVALPVFFVLLHLSISRNRQEWKPIGAMFLMAFVSGAYVLWAASTTVGSQAGSQASYTPLQYLSSEGMAILRYFRLLLLPVGQTVDPQIPEGQWLAWLPIVALALVSLKYFPKARPGFWFLAGLVLLLPSSSIFPANDLAADRRVYLPMVCFGAAIGFVSQKLDRRILWGLALLLAGLSGYRSWVWQSGERLWREAVTLSPSKVRPRIQLSRSLPPNEAIPVLNEAKAIAPDHPLLASELGRVYLALGRPAEALAEFGRVLALLPNDPQALSNRGVALVFLKQTEAGRADFERALKIAPCSFEARLNLLQLGVPTSPPASCSYTAKQMDALAHPPHLNQ